MRQFRVNRRTLSIVLCLVLVSVFTLTIAYAALSVTLNITGNAEIVASSWNIHLDNPKVSSGSVHNNLPTISGNTLSFSSNLTDPGDYYEFTVDVVNDGSIDAMIDSVVVNPVLTDSQKKYLRYEVTYQNGESISNKQLLKKKTSMPIKVRVEFRDDIPVSDLPSTATTLNHSVTLVYSQSDNNTSNVINGGVAVAYADGDINEIGTVVTIGTEQFYTIGLDGENVKLLAMYNLHVGGVYDASTTTYTLYNDSATNLQDSTMLGGGIGATIRNGVLAFATDEQHGQNVSDYSGSLVEIYVNKYKIKLNELGVRNLDARLITHDELVELGCPSTTVGYCTSSQHSWVYSTSYWTMSASNGYNNWRVDRGDGYFQSNTTTYFGYCGVRPVIVIPRNSIIVSSSEKEIISFTINDTDYYADSGMSWANWISSEYNTYGFTYSDAGYVYNSSGKAVKSSSDCAKIGDIIQSDSSYTTSSYSCE